MNITITMAGAGSRFRKVGYTVPKYQIEVNGHTLFYWSMLSLAAYQEKRYIFVVQKDDHARRFISVECGRLGVEPVIVEIDHLTAGQAETALMASAYWNMDEPLLVYNIDTYIEPGHMSDRELKGDGFIPCFAGAGDHWSFVRTEPDGRAAEVREKRRISDHCTVGAYYFKTAALYRELYKEFYDAGDKELEAGERYIAPLYNYLIQAKNGEVYISDIPAAFVHVLGTPEEVTDFRLASQRPQDASRSSQN